MTIQKIMVPFTTQKAAEGAFDLAAPVAKRFRAHIDAMHLKHRPQVGGDFYYPVGMPYVKGDVDAMKAKADELAADLRARFEALCARHEIEVVDKVDMTMGKGATASWTALEEGAPGELSYRARVADMIACARPDASTSFEERAIFEDMLFQSARPVLTAAPGAATGFPATAFVAWDGGRESARAMAAAIPFLQEVDLAIVATVGDTDWAAEAPESAAAYLRLHGVHATHLHVRAQKGETPDALLLEHARRKNADLVVMGAYSRTRWREVVLGGFTRHMLKHADTPLLMTH